MVREAKTKLPTTGSPQDTSYNEKWVKLVVHSHTHTHEKKIRAGGEGEIERSRFSIKGIGDIFWLLFFSEG